jgi:Schlafen group 3, DNA/RNA helicase domain
MNRAFYCDSIEDFLRRSADQILGVLAKHSDFSLEQTQRDAWLEEIRILHSALSPYQGSIYFEYSIPRMGRRIDVVLLIGAAVFVLEFKVGQQDFPLHALDQVLDYALDLKNFHEPSHKCLIAPILIATSAPDCQPVFEPAPHKDGLFLPIKTNGRLLGDAIETVLRSAEGVTIDQARWESGRYRPTPTIIEAALALYGGHSVADISRSDASAINLNQTSGAISSIIEASRVRRHKALCFVTGVPGAGKTLVGLNMATTHIDKASELYSVFLSGNGPLVDILREALARDRVRQKKERGEKLKKGAALSEVKAFIQNIHHFRDESIRDANRPPIEHVAIFDEAQRAWNLEQTSSFMRRKKRIPNFNQSEPEFLISCLNRHPDWAVIVCLVGGGQEINTGEAGITEWIDSLLRSFSDWHIYISPHLTDSEYGAGQALSKIRTGVVPIFETNG